MALANCNLATYFVDAQVAKGNGTRVAIQCGDTAVTYAELAELVNRTGNGLLGLGLRRGQRALLAVSDGIEFVAIWYACQKIGLVTAECYTFLRPKDYAYYLSYTNAAVVFVDGTTLGPMRAGAAYSPEEERSYVVVGTGQTGLRRGERAFSALVESSPSTLDAAVIAPDEVAVWKFTTGSTGAPKACVHTASHPISSHEAYGLGVLGIGPSDKVLPVPKLFFGYARDLAALYPFGVGGSGIIFPERATAEEMFELIAKWKPTILVNVPTMIGAMLAHPSASQQDLSCLRLCTSAGEALPPELHRRWLDTFGVEVLDGIGSSEAYHIYLSNRPGSARPGTVGEEVPGYRCRVVAGPAGEPPVGGGLPASAASVLAAARTLPDGEVGRLAISGPTIALEYFGDAAKTERSFYGDTVVSEDLFVRHADGYFSYVGRADDLLKVSGIWVAPAEIEDCLRAHPDVAECAVVGQGASGLTKAIAYVVLTAASPAPEAAAAKAVELRTFVHDRLAPHKVPRELRFVGELPRTANGKVDRRALGADAPTSPDQPETVA